MLRVALLGCGRIGTMHAQNLMHHPHTELVFLYDVQPGAMSTLSERLDVPAATSPTEIFASPQVDAVLIATVTSTHADYIEMAVAAGKPVFCEKPIDLDLERVNKCAKTISGSSVPIQLGFNRRYDPGHNAARNSMLEGNIGNLHQVIITSRDPELPPRSYIENAGGLFRDMTIHDFDLCRFMLGEEPTEVFAMANALIDPELVNELGDVDTAMFILRTQSGKQCHINNSRTAVYGYDQRVELLGSNGMIISKNKKPHEMRSYNAKGVDVGEPYAYFFLERYKEAFLASLDSFVDCVENGSRPLAGFEDGWKALVLAEAAYKSIKEKRSVFVSEIEAQVKK